MLIFPLLILLTVAPGPGRSDAVMADFSRFSKSIAQEIAIVDYDGTVREGILTAATEDGITVQFGSGVKSFPRAAVASAERTRDGRTDGAIKGALWGALIGAIMSQAYEGSDWAGAFVGHVAIYSGIGWTLDAAQSHREPIYRAPAAAATPKPSVKFSFRF